MRPDHLVIPAAGLGTRVRSVSGGRPKEMLDIGGRPAIRYAVEEGISAGIRNIAVIISRKKEEIRRYLTGNDVSSRLSSVGARLTFFYQDEPLGEADAIALTEAFVGHSPLAVLNPDNVFLPCGTALKSLAEACAVRGRNGIALVKVTEKTASGLGASGRVDLEPLEEGFFRVDRIHPKGNGLFKPRFPVELRSCGLWVAGPNVFPFLHRARRATRGGEFTDGAVLDVILREEGLYGILLPGTHFDIGNPEGYRLCSNYAAAFLSGGGNSP